MLALRDIHRLHLADVTLPQGTPLAGQPYSVYGFVIMHPDGTVLVDTGIGAGHAGIEALYQPVRNPLAEQLAPLGINPSHSAAGVNTHLHFDHCGENHLLSGVPIYVQRAEYEAAQQPGYTVRDWVDFPGSDYRLLDGDTEVLSGVTILSTPGHTSGHQSVLVETSEGPALIAGHAALTADEWENPEPGHVLGLQAAWNGQLYTKSLRRLRGLNPHRVYFSHDPTVWERAD